MADVTFIQSSEFDSADFDVGVTTPGQFTLQPVVKLKVSADAGNILSAGADTGVLFTQADLQASETAFAATSSTGALTITAGGTNGHAPTFAFNYADAAFIEGVQDAVGSAIMEGVGITYDDALNAISSAAGNLTFGNGLVNTSGTVSVVADPASPDAVTVSASGVSVTTGISSDAGNLASLGTDNRVMVDPAGVTGLATINICNLAGDVVAKAFA